MQVREVSLPDVPGIACCPDLLRCCSYSDERHPIFVGSQDDDLLPPGQETQLAKAAHCSELFRWSPQGQILGPMAAWAKHSERESEVNLVMRELANPLQTHPNTSKHIQTQRESNRTSSCDLVDFLKSTESVRDAYARLEMCMVRFLNSPHFVRDSVEISFRFLGMDGDLGRAADGGPGRGCWRLLGHRAASTGTGGGSSAVGTPGPMYQPWVGTSKIGTIRHSDQGNSWLSWRFDLWI